VNSRRVGLYRATDPRPDQHRVDDLRVSQSPASQRPASQGSASQRPASQGSAAGYRRNRLVAARLDFASPRYWNPRYVSPAVADCADPAISRRARRHPATVQRAGLGPRTMNSRLMNQDAAWRYRGAAGRGAALWACRLADHRAGYRRDRLVPANAQAAGPIRRAANSPQRRQFHDR
jgi:hypothetical protein